MDGTTTRYWLGGTACAGKSTVGRALVTRYELCLYAWDEHFEAHRQRALAESERWSAFAAIMEDGPEALFAPPAAQRAAELTAFYRDEFALVLEDLDSLAATESRPILIEGAGVDPQALARCGVPRHQALFLLAPESLRRQRYRQHRSEEVDALLGPLADPEAAFERWMERDEHRHQRLLNAAPAAGYQTLTVEGRETAEELVQRVARHFQLSVPGATRPPSGRRTG